MNTLKIESHGLASCFKLSRKSKSYFTVAGTSLIYFAMGLYFAAGNTGVYLTSYLIYRSNSNMKLDDAIWFLSAAGFSALLLPLGGWLEGKIGVRGVCILGGSLQSFGILATYYALDTTFLIVVIVYGGSFLLSLASCYTSPMVNVCKWHPKHKGLVTGIGAASMAVAPTLFTPLITKLVNPNNIPANSLGLFEDEEVLDRTKNSTLIQGSITLTLFAIGILMTFPAEPEVEEDNRKFSKNTVALKRYTNFEDLNLTSEEFIYGSKASKKIELVIDFKPRDEPDISDSTSPQDFSIEPKFAFKTIEFWLLSLKVLISELIFIYLLFMYKPYGQTFIHDDYFLSAIGAACAISNTVGRLTMGHFKDKFGYQAISIPLSAITMLSISLMPLTKFLDNRTLYATSVILAVGGVGSQYALMPSAAQDSFGDKYASINIGFVYMSTVIATVSSALLSQYLTSYIGWEGMIYLVATCAAIDFVSTFFMPTNPSRRLMKRYKQFYVDPEIKKSDNDKKITTLSETILAA